MYCAAATRLVVLVVFTISLVIADVAAPTQMLEDPLVEWDTSPLVINPTLKQKRLRSTLELDNGSHEQTQPSIKQKRLPSTLELDGGYDERTQRSTNCPPLWLEFEQQCYWTSEYVTHWHRVAAECNHRSAGSLPVSVHSTLQNAVIVSQLRGQRAWLGLKRDIDGLFQWSDSTEYDFTFWEQDEPRRHGHCGLINADISGQWAAVECHQEHVFVCQRPASACPDGWRRFDNTCYMFNETSIFGDELGRACALMREDAEPASVHSRQNNNFLVSLLGGASYQSAFIGLSRRYDGGEWRWDDGSAFDFSNWVTPPAYSDRVVYMSANNGGLWRGVAFALYPFFCQIRLEAGPYP